MPDHCCVQAEEYGFSALLSPASSQPVHVDTSLILILSSSIYTEDFSVNKWKPLNYDQIITMSL